ncbi:SETD3 [Branchiostoma lanceolatum]|uniref:SETD3 protein n=1 Tax=Branchiostoma lanceolatum TaxID=7740 RepID=A0A8K0EMU0_BRALA|nr:SETD3 [Branchiostoma lanceolatum]
MGKKSKRDRGAGGSAGGGKGGGGGGGNTKPNGRNKKDVRDVMVLVNELLQKASSPGVPPGKELEEHMSIREVVERIRRKQEVSRQHSKELGRNIAPLTFGDEDGMLHNHHLEGRCRKKTCRDQGPWRPRTGGQDGRCDASDQETRASGHDARRPHCMRRAGSGAEERDKTEIGEDWTGRKQQGPDCKCGKNERMPCTVHPTVCVRVLAGPSQSYSTSGCLKQHPDSPKQLLQEGGDRGWTSRRLGEGVRGRATKGRGGDNTTRGAERKEDSEEAGEVQSTPVRDAGVVMC